MLSTISFSGHGRSRSATATMSVQAIATTKLHCSAVRLPVTILRNLVFTNSSVQNCLGCEQQLGQLLQCRGSDSSDGAEGACREERRGNVPVQCVPVLWGAVA